MSKLKELREYFYKRGDDYCNQKYGGNLPYSFHLKCVEQQGEKFLYLVGKELIENNQNQYSDPVSLVEIVRLALTAHESIEDFRLTYNDVREIANGLGNAVAGEIVAEIVYAVTDEKGKTRTERKNEKYYRELGKNKLAVFVKLADISANTLFSKLTDSSMYDKYKSEFSHFKEMCFYAEYEDYFNYVESL